MWIQTRRLNLTKKNSKRPEKLGTNKVMHINIIEYYKPVRIHLKHPTYLRISLYQVPANKNKFAVSTLPPSKSEPKISDKIGGGVAAALNLK
jgi:hypothetical protein